MGYDFASFLEQEGSRDYVLGELLRLSSTLKPPKEYAFNTALVCYDPASDRFTFGHDLELDKEFVLSRSELRAAIRREIAGGLEEPPGATASSVAELPSTVQLMWALALLCLPAEYQQRFLEQIGTAPSTDELAMELAEAMMPWRPALADGSDVPVLVTLALPIDELLTQVSGEPEDVWHVRALSTSVMWRQVRELAAECLIAVDPTTRASRHSRLR
jgi:hypothetical protein